MPETFLIGVDTAALDRSYRRLFLVLADNPDRAIQLVKNVWPKSKVEWTGIKALPETAEKLALRPEEPIQL
jgi:hypothetical protein